MSDLFPCDHGKPLIGHATRDAFCLCIAFAHVGRVRVVALRKARLYELLYAEYGGSLEAVEFCLYVGAYSGVEGFSRLRGEYFAAVDNLR